MTWTCMCGKKGLTAKEAKEHLHGGRFEFFSEGRIAGEIPSLNVREKPDVRLEELKAGKKITLGGA